LPRALLSVTDKTDLVPFAKGLVTKGFEILSTGGTAKALREAGVLVRDVSDVTQFPEMLDGRVKTLHPMVHGGLLGDMRLDTHRQQMASAGIEPISILCVNLYRFEQTVNAPHEIDDAIESIDIGGPAMIRAGAKNWRNVLVVVDPTDYELVLDADPNDSMRLKFSAKAFRHTAFYDSMVSRYLTGAAGESLYQESLTVGMRRKLALRYGENPHQSGALYLDPLNPGQGIAYADPIWGLEVGYNNINDANGAWNLVNDLPEPACAITKHGNPCGVAIGATFADSFRMARDADPVSAFGGVVAFNGKVDEAAAAAMTEKGNKLDVVIATGFTPVALEMFKSRKGWGQEVRLLQTPKPSKEVSLTVRSVSGGFLAQDSDRDPADLDDLITIGTLPPTWQVVTKTAPTIWQLKALGLLWKIIPHVKSNAIVVGKHDRLLGVGAGQMNRVQSVRLALEQAGEESHGAALASDAFFPFPDSIEVAAEAGIAAIAQPGGSKKDPDVIAAADERGIAMVLTGVRHFLH
jgi:phosphoribosylaminoimidazolecarboxamide formyltransferase/IMP cyclohydrolase